MSTARQRSTYFAGAAARRLPRPAPLTALVTRAPPVPARGTERGPGAAYCGGGGGGGGDGQVRRGLMGPQFRPILHSHVLACGWGLSQQTSSGEVGVGSDGGDSGAGVGSDVGEGSTVAGGSATAGGGAPRSAIPP